MTAAPARCPYCGSIENHGNICDWCHSPISDDYYINESRNKKMKIKLEFTDLDPTQALELIKCATARSEEERVGEPAPAMTTTAPVKPAAPVLPAPAAAPPASAVPVQAVPTAVPVQATAAVAPVAPVASAAPAASSATAPIPTAPPTAVKQYTADELAVAVRPVCEMPGGREKLLNLLHSFTYTDSTGTVRTVQSIMDMPPEQYPALASGIRQLGGRI